MVGSITTARGTVSKGRSIREFENYCVRQSSVRGYGNWLHFPSGSCFLFSFCLHFCLDVCAYSHACTYVHLCAYMRIYSHEDQSFSTTFHLQQSLSLNLRHINFSRFAGQKILRILLSVPPQC